MKFNCNLMLSRLLWRERETSWISIAGFVKLWRSREKNVNKEFPCETFNHLAENIPSKQQSSVESELEKSSPSVVFVRSVKEVITFRNGCRRAEEENINTFKVNLFSFYYSVLFYIFRSIPSSVKKRLILQEKFFVFSLCSYHWKWTESQTKVSGNFTSAINPEFIRKSVKKLSDSFNESVSDLLLSRAFRSL